MVDCVVFFKYQIAYKYKLISVVFQALKDCRQCLGRVVGVVVEQYYRPGQTLEVTRLQILSAVLPFKTVNNLYRSNKYIKKLFQKNSTYH